MSHLTSVLLVLQVRDLLTTENEQQAIRSGSQKSGSLSQDAVMVDAIVSTIGFPLVGGPAGSMEGGRQAEIAKGILGAKNVPYLVAAPLLIQVIQSCRSKNSISLFEEVLKLHMHCIKLEAGLCFKGILTASALSVPKGKKLFCKTQWQLDRPPALR